MSAIRNVPHPFPYQGSKRQLAREIIACIPSDCRTLFEPFAGSAAVTLAAAYLGLARRFVINDAHRPLVHLWNAIVRQPHKLAAEYRALWTAQAGCEREYFDLVRSEFNKYEHPGHFLYLLARCVKAAVRYNAKGEFNNSPDNRRRGMHPDTMERNISRAARLLRDKTTITLKNYEDVLVDVKRRDLVYMDPPYQGVCNTRDHRYCRSVAFDDFVSVLEQLNQRSISFIISYDGRTGAKTHGRHLPEELDLIRIELLVGRSTQATLLGRNHNTYESLYLSPALIDRLGEIPPVFADADEPCLFS